MSVVMDDIEAKARDTEQPMTSADFGKYITLMDKNFRAVIRLTKAAGGLKSGEKLRVTGPDNISLEMTTKDVASLATEFSQDLKDLKKIFKSGKKRRTVAKKKPAVRSFSGVYNPMYFGPSLQEYFKTEDFGNGVGASGTWAQNGLGLKAIVTLAFYVANYNSRKQRGEMKTPEGQNGQIVYPTNAMANAFGGNTAALFSYGNNVKDAKGKPIRSDNNAGMNTFDILTAAYANKISTSRTGQVKNDTFVREGIKMFFFQSMTSLNIDKLDSQNAMAGLAGLETDSGEAVLGQSGNLEATVLNTLAEEYENMKRLQLGFKREFGKPLNAGELEMAAILGV
jgi:hypothetical protein